MSMIVALYDDLKTVERVTQELESNGFDRNRIHLATHDPRAQQKSSGGFFESLSNLFGREPEKVGDQPANLVDRMTHWGVPEQDAHQYAEAVRRGSTMLMVDAPSEQAQNARQIMESYNPIDLDQRAAGWQQSGWRGYDENAKPFTENEVTQERTRFSTPASDTGETHIPIVEEEMRVGKRQVQGGGVRVHTTVSERPVEETHTLRDETVSVERRPSDRTLQGADLDNAFREQTFEVTETNEELIADKQARVTGEVVVRKQANEREETVRDTVRRTEVNTEDLAAGQPRHSGFDAYNNDFRNHFSLLRNPSGRDYSYYEPGYRYGYDLAGNDRYRDMKWSEVESRSRKDWERLHPNSKWEDFKDSIRYGWERATSGARGTSTTGTADFTGTEGYDTETGKGTYVDPNNP